MIKPRKIKCYGWRPDVPDHRDHKFTSKLVPAKLPRSVDERKKFPPCYDQGALGSCTGNAIAAALQYDRRKQKLTDFIPSRLFIYYNEREIEGTINEDAGAEIRDGIKAVAKLGAPDEQYWPYNIHAFARRPSDVAYTAALDTQAIEYARVEQTADGIKGALAEGFPVTFGFAVYESFESARVEHTGTVPMPKPSEQMLGGHAVLIVGYHDEAHYHRFIVRNSWGTDWGHFGYFTMPFDYVLNNDLADDFWVIRSVG